MREAGERTASTYLAGFVAGLSMDGLSPRVVHEAKRCLIDTIGAALAGTRTEEVTRLLAAVNSNPRPAADRRFPTSYSMEVPANRGIL